MINKGNIFLNFFFQIEFHVMPTNHAPVHVNFQNKK